MRDYYAEAVKIVKGATRLLPEREHLVALYQRLELGGLLPSDEEKAFARMEEDFHDSRSGA